MQESIESVTTKAKASLASMPISAATENRLPAQPQETISDLFTRLGAECGHKFTSTMPDRRSRRAVSSVWAERLAGLQLSDLQRGIDCLPEYLRAHNWWPPGASEFRELCLPGYADFGMPEIEEAYQQATTRDYSHPGVMWAASRCNHALHFQDSRQARHRFAKEYREALDRARAGFEFPPIPARLAYKPPEPLSTERQRELAAQMHQRLATENFELPQEESHGSA